MDDTKQCPYCAETIKVGAVVCRFCNRSVATGQLVGQPPAAPIPLATSANAPSEHWSRQPLYIGLLLVLCAPVGVVLMWLYAPWSNKAKWIVTAVACVFMIGVSNSDDDKQKKPGQVTPPTSTAVVSGPAATAADTARNQALDEQRRLLDRQRQAAEAERQRERAGAAEIQRRIEEQRQQAGKTTTVTRQQMGDKWPLTVDGACWPAMGLRSFLPPAVSSMP